MSMQYGLYLLGHQDLVSRPDRSERALRVFFPEQSGDYFAQLNAGDSVLVRSGERTIIDDFGSALRAQGFQTETRTLDPAG